MATERAVLKKSLAATLFVSALGIGFGVLSGSFAVLFDGVFSLVDASMTVLSLFVTRLIARSTVSGDLSETLRRRFSFGFWHLEPMVLTLNATILVSVTTYALFNAAMSLWTGGRSIEFGPAIAYAVTVFAVCAAMALYEHRANRTIGSNFIKIDAQGWIMAGGITFSLLVAFGAGYLLDGSTYRFILPYIDPAVLLCVGLFILPMPIRTLRDAFSELLLMAPDDLLQQIEEIADRIVRQEGFCSHRIYAARVGRGTQIELHFIVPVLQPARRLEEWDALRKRIGAEIGGDPRHRWLTIAFTTAPELAG